MALKSKKKDRIIRGLPLHEVESGAVHIPPGEYGMKCVEAEQDESGNGNPMIAWVFQGTEGKAKGKRFYYYTVLGDTSYWKLRQTLEGLGMEIPDSPLDLDLDEVIGLEGTGIVEDDEYEGKTRSKLTGFVNGGEEEEEEEPPAKATRGGKKKTIAKVSSDEVQEMDEDELESLLAKHELEVDLSEYKILKRKRAAVIAALEESDLLG